MGPGYFVLAVMGCGDGAVMCQEIDRQTTAFPTEAACMAATETALDDAAHQPYPMVMVQCQHAAPQMAEANSNSRS